MKIILASSSENRKALFDRLKVDFEVRKPSFEEKINFESPPKNQVTLFSLEKAKSVYPEFENNPNVCILGFDSMVEFEGQSIGKPKTKKEAFQMLQSFVGKKQKIVSGLSIVGNFKGKYFEKSDVESTEIFFRSDLTNCQIRQYLKFNDFSGKCGAYSILGTGIFLLEKINGDFQNIIGVPVLKMGEMIREVTKKNPVWIFSPK